MDFSLNYVEHALLATNYIFWDDGNEDGALVSDSIISNQRAQVVGVV